MEKVAKLGDTFKICVKKIIFALILFNLFIFLVLLVLEILILIKNFIFLTFSPSFEREERIIGFQYW